MNKHALSVFFGYVIWGLLPIYWKILDGLPSIFILCSRIVLSCLCCGLLVIALKKGRLLKAAFKSKKPLLNTVLAGIAVSLNWFLYIWAVTNNHIVDASLGYYINPLVVFLFSLLFFKEKASTLDYVAVALASVGVLLMIIQAGTFPFIALTLAFTFGIYGVFKKKANMDSSVSLFIETLVMTPIALIYLMIFSFGDQGILTSATPTELIALSLAGIVTSVPLLMYSIGVVKIPLSVVGFFQYVSPTLSLLLGVLVYGEKINPAAGTALVFVWLGLIIFSYNKFIQSKRASALKKGLE